MTQNASAAEWVVHPIMGGFVLNKVEGGRKVQNGPAFLVSGLYPEEEARREAEKEAARRNAGKPA